MLKIDLTIGRLLVLSLSLLSALDAARAAEPLQLVGTSHGHEFREFTVQHGQIVAREGTTFVPVPAETRWRLDGELSAHAEYLMLSPGYSILTRWAVGMTGGTAPRTFGIVTLKRGIASLRAKA